MRYLAFHRNCGILKKVKWRGKTGATGFRDQDTAIVKSGEP